VTQVTTAGSDAHMQDSERMVDKQEVIRFLPSSQAALPPPGPLRTGREGFPSPSSSPSNASLGETRFRNGKTLTMNPVMALGMK
jgi:hypothetical protein